jgi:hypothetical protein
MIHCRISYFSRYTLYPQATWKRIKLTAMKFDYETEQVTDGRRIAEALEFAGVLASGVTEVEAIANAESLALRVFVERERDLLPTHSPCGSGPQSLNI